MPGSAPMVPVPPFEGFPTGPFQGTAYEPGPAPAPLDASILVVDDDAAHAQTVADVEFLFQQSFKPY